MIDVMIGGVARVLSLHGGGGKTEVTLGGQGKRVKQGCVREDKIKRGVA